MPASMVLYQPKVVTVGFHEPVKVAGYKPRKGRAKADAGTELLLAGFDSGVARGSTESAEVDSIGVRVPPLHAAVAAVQQRIDLVAQSEVDRQLSSCPPAVLDVQAVLPFSGHHVEELD
jgi:hypothetical protein